LATIYAGVYGSGLGHATRTYEIGKRLVERGNNVLYSSFEEGFDYLRLMNQPVYRAPSIGIKWNVAGGVSGRDTFVSSPLTIFRFWRQTRFESDIIRKYRPKVVVSDSRLSTLFAAKSTRYQTVTILNQIKILFPARFRGDPFSRLLERVEGDILGLMWSLSDEILFPDLPPPYTISEANIAGVDVSSKVRYVGFMMPRISVPPETLSKLKQMLELDSRPTVFIQISGPNPTKPLFLASALECAKRLSSRFCVIVSKGLPGGSSVARKIANGSWLFDWCPIKDELFLLSNVLVTRAGHTTISQCINEGKPSVLVPIFNHSEQLSNATKFAKLGLGRVIMPEQLTPDAMIEAIEQCIEDPVYRSKMELISKIAARYPGLENAASTVLSYL
jgi:UDP-N-acetylglucosamine--N-acetylmuramyl-(pentapeptide) pyrophosphoryl-undecaprenol N-acetylglucosamine transferase